MRTFITALAGILLTFSLALPAHAISDAEYTQLAASSAEFKAADARLNKAWKGLNAAVAKEKRGAFLEEQRVWVKDARESAFAYLTRQRQLNLPVPKAVLRDGKVDKALVFALVTATRAEVFEQYTAQLKGGKASFAGRLEYYDDRINSDRFMVLADGVTRVSFCRTWSHRPDWLDDEANPSNVTGKTQGRLVEDYVRMSGRMKSLDAMACDTNLRMEKIPLPSGAAEESKPVAAEKRERTSVSGEFCQNRVGGLEIPCVQVSEDVWYVFGDYVDPNHDICENAAYGERITVTGTLVTPGSGMPYFDHESTVICKRAAPSQK